METRTDHFNSRIAVGGRSIGPGCPVFVIAEAGVNHNGDVSVARRLIDCAVHAKADAVKFQTFAAHRLNTRTAPKSSYHLRTTPPDAAESWYDLLRRQEMNLEMHRTLQDYCQKRGVLFLSTPYDFESVDLLHDMEVPAFKIASTDANNTPFLSYVASKGKPVLLSTAMCTMAEVAASVEAVRSAGNRDLVLLHCTADYPSAVETSHLRAMATMAQAFGTVVGYSDHCPERINPIAAVALGAVVVEKHFTLSRDLPGPDHQASLLPEELCTLVRDIRMTEAALGSPVKEPLACEAENRRKLRKSIVAQVNIVQGTRIGRDMIAFKRPGTGMPPGDLFSVLGRRACRDIAADTLITRDMLEAADE